MIKNLVGRFLKKGGRIYLSLILSSRVCFSSRALMATSCNEPDIGIAAISSRRISSKAARHTRSAATSAEAAHVLWANPGIKGWGGV